MGPRSISPPYSKTNLAARSYGIVYFPQPARPLCRGVCIEARLVCRRRLGASFSESGDQTLLIPQYTMSARCLILALMRLFPYGRDSMNRCPAPVLYLPYCGVSLSQLGDKVNSDTSPPWAYWTLVATLLVWLYPYSSLLPTR